MIFETHAHYDDEVFNEDREQLLAGLPEKGIGRVINVGASIETTRTTLALAEAYDYIYAAVGVHPSDIDGLNEETYSWLKAQTAHPKTVAVGEIGLDYYWDKEPEVQAAQREWFVRQLTLAGETDLPVIIHSRDAAEDTMRILKETGRFREHPGVIHCYSYSPEQAKEYVKMGYCIGVGGVVTFKNAKETQADGGADLSGTHSAGDGLPVYGASEPHRGTRNDSSNLSYVAARIAEIKGVSVQEVEQTTWENACRVFGVR